MKAYDVHGVWPVPGPFDVPPPHRRSRRHSEHPRHDPFFAFTNNFNHFPGMPGNSFNPQHHRRNDFTDPFVLFNAMFGDFERSSADPMEQLFERPQRQRSTARPRRHDDFGRAFPFGSSDMGRMFSGMGMSGNMFPGFPNAGLGPGTRSGPRWRKETKVTTSVNGVTHSKLTREDSDVS